MGGSREVFAVEELGKRIGGDVSFELTFNSKELYISKNIQLIIFRVIQEFISNSLKHAQAKYIEVHVNSSKEKTRVHILDDGIGFDKNMIKAGRGIHNIETRLKALQVEYEFSSSPGNGTDLKLIIDNEKD